MAGKQEHDEKQAMRKKHQNVEYTLMQMKQESRV